MNRKPDPLFEGPEMPPKEKIDSAFKAAKILAVFDYDKSRLPGLARMLKRLEVQWRLEEEGLDATPVSFELKGKEEAEAWRYAYMLYYLDLRLQDMPFLCGMVIQEYAQERVDEMIAEDAELSPEARWLDTPDYIERERQAFVNEPENEAIRREIATIVNPSLN